jgi:hypothetical protein
MSMQLAVILQVVILQVAAELRVIILLAVQAELGFIL